MHSNVMYIMSDNMEQEQSLAYLRPFLVCEMTGLSLRSINKQKEKAHHQLTRPTRPQQNNSQFSQSNPDLFPFE